MSGRGRPSERPPAAHRGWGRRRSCARRSGGLRWVRCRRVRLVQARRTVPAADWSTGLVVFPGANPVTTVAITLWPAAVAESSSTADRSLIAGFVSFNHYSEESLG